MAKYKVKNTTILHDGVSKGEGSIIELTDRQAEKLADYIELIKDKAPAKQTTEKTKTKTEQHFLVKCILSQNTLFFIYCKA